MSSVADAAMSSVPDAAMKAFAGGLDVGSNRQRGEPLDKGDTQTIRICGALGSPYTNKILAMLRYRRLTHRFLIMGSPEEQGTAHPTVPKSAQRLLPKIVWADGSASNDSTFLINDLEKRFKVGVRSVVPQNKALAFLSHLLEDWADEWLTKSMYHYRWTHDAEYAGKLIALHQAGIGIAESTLRSIASTIQARQVGRRDLVGSNPTTAHVIEEGFERFLDLFDAHLSSGHRFLFGSRPSAADFAIFGQLHSMISLDPQTSQRVRCRTQRVVAWYQTTADLSGLSVLHEDQGWLTHVPPTLTAILHEVGRFYVPFMLANDVAVKAGNKDVRCKLDDGRVEWRQPSFKYQSKCLHWLWGHFHDLSPSDSQWVVEALQGTGCLALLSSALRPRM